MRSSAITLGPLGIADTSPSAEAPGGHREPRFFDAGDAADLDEGEMREAHGVAKNYVRPDEAGRSAAGG